MDRSDVCTLVSVTYTADEIGQRIPTETQNQVYCSVNSVSAQEFFAAGQNGLKAEIRINVFFADYAGQETVLYNGIRYGVYRTYRKKDDEVELYCERKAGA